MRHIGADEIIRAMTPGEADAYLQHCERHEAAQATVRQAVAHMAKMRERVRQRIRQAEAITGKDER